MMFGQQAFGVAQFDSEIPASIAISATITPSIGSIAVLGVQTVVIALSRGTFTPAAAGLGVVGKQTGAIQLPTAVYAPSSGALGISGAFSSLTGTIPLGPAAVTFQPGSLTVTGVSTNSGTGIRSPDGRLLVFRDIYGQPVNLNLARSI